MNTKLVEIFHALRQHKPVVVATVINSRGSTPRTAGSKLIVYSDSATSGTIGGGAIEGDVIRRASAVFAERLGCTVSYDLRSDGKSQDLDLICGGYMEVVLEYVHDSPDNKRLYGEACEKIGSEEPFLWNARIQEIDRGLLFDRYIENISDLNGARNQKASIQTFGAERLIVEPVFPAETAFIIGAGHVSRQIARLTRQIAMKTLVFDDRSEFANKSRFPEADGIHVCPDYVNIFESFNITSRSYIIIVTRGHNYDKEVLAQALKTRAGYIGMMGSRKKRRILYNALIAEGVDSRQLDKVHCPIGLPIKAETPAELAVSIVAEIINHRASQEYHD